jgi:hypothetical protein
VLTSFGTFPEHFRAAFQQASFYRIAGVKSSKVEIYRRALGIETNLNRFLVINEKKLSDYLARITTAAGHHRRSRDYSFQTSPVLDSNPN